MGHGTNDNIQIKIKMPNLSQKPPVSYKAPNEDLNDMDATTCSEQNKSESNSNFRIELLLAKPNHAELVGIESQPFQVHTGSLFIFHCTNLVSSWDYLEFYFKNEDSSDERAKDGVHSMRESILHDLIQGEPKNIIMI